MSYLIKPQNYKPLLDLKQTELGIKQIKDFFSTEPLFRTETEKSDCPPFCSERDGDQR